MKLTPVKVRGKEGQKKKWRPPAQPLRRKTRLREDETDRTVVSDGGPRRRRFKSRRPAATIEELPTEILERIIFMSRNLNLLRSSLRIGYRFSSPSFLNELIEAAFAPTWDIWYGYDTGAVCLKFKHYIHIPGDPAFQSAVLACKWANAELILEAQQKWYRRNGGPGRIAEHLKPSEKPPPAVERAADVASRFERDWETFKSRCATIFQSDDPGVLDRIVSNPNDEIYREIHPSTAVPDRLLTGPFNWETARTSFWLARGGARLLRDHTWTWELSKIGYDHIMTVDDEQLAVVLLLLLAKLETFKHWPDFLLQQELERADRQLEHSKKRWWCASLVIGSWKSLG